MKRRVVWLGVLALSACSRPADSREAPDTAAADTTQRGADSIGYEAVASYLDIPWALAFAPAADGRMFFTERPGRIRVMRNGRVEPQPWAAPSVAAVGEAGLMGIAVAPDFATTGHVYVCMTVRDGRSLINRVVRYTDRNGAGADPTVIVDRIPSAEFHAGDAVAFGPDGMLYVATGDARDPGLAQNPASLAGKILRYTPDGQIPADNPAPGSPVYAMGLRNVQGLAWDPVTRYLFATEHGPSGFPNERLRRNNDELNAIRAGRNYGWPSVVGSPDRQGYVDAIITWNPGIAPSGVAVYTGPVADWREDVFVGALKGQHLRRLEGGPYAMGSAGWRVTRETRLFPELGRIRAVAMGPDGFLYFTTSNKDGRGIARAGDDHIYRLIRK